MAARQATPRSKEPDSRKAAFKEGMEKTDAAKETKVGDALDGFHLVPINGKPFTFSKLTFGDLGLIEKYYEDVPSLFEGIENGKSTATLLLVWLQIRKTEAALELDDMLGWTIRNKVSLAELAGKAIMASGLFDVSEPDPNGERAGAEDATDTPSPSITEESAGS